MNNQQIEQLIREYINGVIHMSLATCADGQPWVCEVHFAVDDDLNIYFRSLASRRHSKEIAQNPKVAGNIVEQHGLTDKPRGVYYEGVAEQLSDVTENHPAYIALSERLGIEPAVLVEAQESDGHKFYKIEVDTFYVFDSRETKPSNKFSLPWRKQMA